MYFSGQLSFVVNHFGFLFHDKLYEYTKYIRGGRQTIRGYISDIILSRYAICKTLFLLQKM